MQINSIFLFALSLQSFRYLFVSPNDKTITSTGHNAAPLTHPQQIPDATSPLAGQTYTGSLRIPMLGDQFFHLDFANSNPNTVHMRANGAVETMDDVFGYSLDDASGFITFHPLEATKQKKKNNRLRRVLYKKDGEMIDMVFHPPMSRKEIVANLRRKISG